jgi:hypothetical protein
MPNLSINDEKISFSEIFDTNNFQLLIKRLPQKQHEVSGRVSIMCFSMFSK